MINSVKLAIMLTALSFILSFSNIAFQQLTNQQLTDNIDNMLTNYSKYETDIKQTDTDTTNPDYQPEILTFQKFKKKYPMYSNIITS